MGGTDEELAYQREFAPLLFDADCGARKMINVPFSATDDLVRKARFLAGTVNQASGSAWERGAKMPKC